MAQVDFTNAVLDVYGNSDKPLTYANYLYFDNTAFFTDIPVTGQISTPNKSIILNSPEKVSILFTGVFTASGTQFLIGDANIKAWKVSNVSFSANDTYSFVIDIEVSGNT